MKKIISTILVCVLLVGCVFTLASCGNKPSGAYEASVDVLGQKVSTTYDFGSRKVEIITKTTLLGNVNTETKEAKYKINETSDGLEITFITEVDGEEQTQTFTYEKGDGYIKIGGIEYTKVD